MSHKTIGEIRDLRVTVYATRVSDRVETHVGVAWGDEYYERQALSLYEAEQFAELLWRAVAVALSENPLALIGG